MKRTVGLWMGLVLGTICLAGCTNDYEAFTQKSYATKENEITEVCIDVRDREIEAVRSPDNQVHIEYFENSKEYYDISILDGNILLMTAMRVGMERLYWHKACCRFPQNIA